MYNHSWPRFCLWYACLKRQQECTITTDQGCASATRILGSRDTVDSNNALLSRGRKMIELVRATIQTTTRIIKTIDGLFQSINYLLSSSMDSFQSIHLYHQIYTKAQLFKLRNIRTGARINCQLEGSDTLSTGVLI